MKEHEIIELLEFIQSNYVICDGFYYSNRTAPNKTINGNQIKHKEIIDEYNKVRKHND